MSRIKQRVAKILVAVLVSGPLSLAFEAPSPVNAAVDIKKPTKVTVVAWNEKSFPTMSRESYSHDFNKVLRMGRGHTVFLMQEITGAPTISEYRKVQRELLLGAHSISFDAAITTRNMGVTKTKAKFYHKSCGLYSPGRRFVESFSILDGRRVAWVSIHLTNGKEPGRDECRDEEINWLKQNIIRPNFERGITTVIGGDINRPELIHWAYKAVPTQQKSTNVQTLMQISVIPAPGVRAHLKATHSLKRGRDVRTDHNVRFTELYLN